MPQTLQKQKYQAYANATQTVARTKQIVLLYDGMIRLLQQAKEAINDKRIEERYTLLKKVNEILTGLQCCLDFEKGEQIAKVLYNFYTLIDLRVFSIHRSNSTQACDEVIAELKKMRDVWDEIDQKNTNALGEEMPKVAVAPIAEVQPSISPDLNVTLSA